MVFGEIESAISLAERVKRWFSRKPSQPGGHEPDTVAARFVAIFENHGVHRNQIPRFFGHGLTVADMANDEAL